MGSMGALITVITDPRNHARILSRRRASPRDVTDITPRSEPRLPNHCHHESHATKPHLAPRGREPSGSSRHYPKPEPGLPNHCQHESMQPCHIPPHRGASPQEVTDITLSRNQGALINAITDPGNYAAFPPKGREPSGTVECCRIHLTLFYFYKKIIKFRIIIITKSNCPLPPHPKEMWYASGRVPRLA